MSVFNIFLITFILGVISNEIGGIIGFFGKSKKESASKIISFTAGITTAIICFELLKEAFEISNKYLVVLFTIIGILFVKILEIVINKIKNNEKNNESLVIVSAMSGHNITEGIAIGSAFKISSILGMSLLMAIMLHNIPEGMIIGNMIRKEDKSKKSVLNSCIIIGIFLGIGAVIGTIIGNLSNQYIMPCLAISAGAMLYIVACELIPGMHSKNGNNKEGIIYIIGFLIGCLMCKL